MGRLPGRDPVDIGPSSGPGDAAEVPGEPTWSGRGPNRSNRLAAANNVIIICN